MRAAFVTAVMALTVTACASTGAVPTTAAAVDDAGARTRAEVLSRYTDDAGIVALRTPDVIGMSAVRADAALGEAGLDMRLVPLDRTQPVTRQFPGPGDPPPPSGTVEVWLGEPPETTATPTPTATPSATPDPTASPSPTATPAPTVDVTTRYVLPPHTPGRLRINPRNLPALPAGTELTGLASWYGPGFHGLTTACGGIYDQNGPTLATRELRCGTVVRITGPTGLTVEATVTDWGPAEWAGRRFDLSAAVFNAIAPLGAGVIPVRVVTVNVPG
ncbi:septal ring lytic transglycosylase RlpA family protein [Euzebya rosea]|uniref:septal ring lytic transglycosylase RlpA family protein n=1 Tax=Euzebya rosea TaxID=2052804 RepID=UPI00130057BD|nr:septal ring lytic transglycosylase RlpA family protein [Euzebya rosea]